MGTTASESLPKSYDGDYKELEVEIPEELKPYEVEAFTVVIINECRWLLDELLRVNKDGEPYIDGRKVYGKIYKLEVVKK